MIELTPSQQAAGVDRTSENIALRSGAGCGKTQVLARRFTELLLSGRAEGNPLRRFAAITFTEKAALEMIQRVRAMLADFASRAGGQDRPKLLDWMEQLPEARISTIHSFCASLLRASAVEAGLDPDFIVCSETVVTDELLHTAAEEAVLRELQDGAEDTAALIAAEDLDRVTEAVAILVDHRGTIDLRSSASRDEILEEWETRRRAWLERSLGELRDSEELRGHLDALRSARCTSQTDKLLGFRDETLRLADAILAADIDALAEALQPMRKMRSPGNYGSKTHWIDPSIVRGHIRAVRDAFTALAPGVEPMGDADEYAADALVALSRLARRAAGSYARQKRRRGMVDFEDLLVMTRDLLRRSPHLRRSVSAGLEQVLIDEAQDTDALQMDIAWSLASPDGQSLQPGRLFLVGDAKQSIYRFRGARVEVFRDRCEQLGQNQQIALDICFRTHPAGVEFINDLFSRLMGDGYDPLQARRSETPPRPSVEILLAEESEALPLQSSRDAQKAQAVLLASRIEEMLSSGEPIVWDRRGGQWRAPCRADIAVCFERTTHSLVYELELQRRGIDYVVLSGTGFFQQQEVYDVLNALRVVENPLDDVAFVGVLRSAMFGLDDNALAHLTATHARPLLANLDPEALRETLPETMVDALCLARDLFGELAIRKNAVGIDEIIRELLDTTAYEAVLLAQFQGRRRCGNIHALLAHARASGTEVSLAEFIRRISGQVLREARQEQASAAGEDEDAVKLMTIHKAKGLEFPVVIVPDINGSRPRVTDAVLHRDDWGLTTRFQARPAGSGTDDDDASPLVHQLARDAEAADENAETLRRFYVALTRHEDHLVLIGADRRTRDGHFDPSGGFLDRMDSVMGLQEALDTGAGQIAYGQGRYHARLERVVPDRQTRRQKPADPPGRALLAESTSPDDLAGKIRRHGEAAVSALPLLGPVAEGPIELAATALGDFDLCPMLYRWRYELRGPLPPLPGGQEQAYTPIAGLDALTLGTVLHHCMQWLNFANPQDPEDLCHRALGDLDLLETTDSRPVRDLLADILDVFAATELREEVLAASDVHRELEFQLPVGPVRIDGQIDLLYRRADGAWRVVDYKSDRLAGHDPADKACRYELQMMLYSAAVARAFGAPPAGATLYFLRSGQSYRFDVDAETIAQAMRRVEETGERLRLARQRGIFERCGRESCDFCRQEALAHLGTPRARS